MLTPPRIPCCFRAPTRPRPPSGWARSPTGGIPRPPGPAPSARTRHPTHLTSPRLQPLPPDPPPARPPQPREPRTPTGVSQLARRGALHLPAPPSPASARRHATHDPPPLGCGQVATALDTHPTGPLRSPPWIARRTTPFPPWSPGCHPPACWPAHAHPPRTGASNPPPRGSPVPHAAHADLSPPRRPPPQSRP
uniref:Uncharacterized protein n=1 Tax=Knipowitschia caucasica TaxID=637954 RepID=A0AAV2LWM3_KNICA